jgi:hypothetical protein
VRQKQGSKAVSCVPGIHNQAFTTNQALSSKLGASTTLTLWYSLLFTGHIVAFMAKLTHHCNHSTFTTVFMHIHHPIHGTFQLSSWHSPSNPSQEKHHPRTHPSYTGTSGFGRAAREWCSLRTGNE